MHVVVRGTETGTKQGDLVFPKKKKKKTLRKHGFHVYVTHLSNTVCRNNYCYVAQIPLFILSHLSSPPPLIQIKTRLI